MNAAKHLFALLSERYQSNIAEFKQTYKHARLGSFVIPYDECLAIEPQLASETSLIRCYCCPAKSEWLRISREMIRSYCRNHQPKPIHKVSKP